MGFLHRPSLNELAKIESPSGWLGIASRIWDAGWPTFKRWRESRKPENRIHLNLESFSLYIEASDKGRADFRLLLVNFATIPLALQNVEVHWWRLASRHLAEQSGVLRASGAVAPGTTARGFFSIGLTSADIRDVIRAVEPSQNHKSAPRAPLEVNATFVFRHKLRELRVSRTFGAECVCLTIPTYIIKSVDTRK